MSVRYIRVNAVSNLFAPATRAFGNIGVVGPLADGPAAPAAAAAAGTALGVGTYRYTATFVTPTFETQAGAEATVTTTAGNQQVNLTNIRTGPPGTTARNLYRTALGRPAGSETFLATIPDNTTTTFNDATPDSGLGTAGIPAVAQPNAPITFTDPADALRRCPGDLGASIQRCFLQTPGPSLVFGVRTAVAGGAPDWTAALDVVSALSVQIVVLANVPITAAAVGAAGGITQLVNHVTTVSNTGNDGMERIGVAMLPRDTADPTVVSGNTALVNERMVYIAHRSDDDAAAAVAGTIAGIEPAISLVLKPVNIKTDLFTPTQIQTINGAVEDRTTGPTGSGVNWLTHPTLIPGGGVFMGEGYTGNPGGGKKFIDIVRVIDDVSFKLKAQLIATIGTLRISRSGLRTLISQMQVVLIPMVDSGILDDFQIHVPLLTILDKPETARTPEEQAAITQAHAQRLIQVVASVSYAAAIHRISIDLVFS
jgi:hypothetical protein